MVVTVVVAVRGLSVDMCDMAAAEDVGSFPVSSSFRILDLRSSSSSHTVEGAVVDKVDSVPSTRDFSVSCAARSAASENDCFRLLRLAERFDC